MKHTVVIMGPTGSGKDTQARQLAEDLGYELVNVGDMVRAEKEQNPQIAAELIHGELADDDFVNGLVAARIDGIGDAPLITNGFPRKLNQAEWLDQFLAELGRQIDCVLYLEVADEVVITRLEKQRKRADDTHEVIKRRLDIFHKETLPVIEHYEARGLLLRIDGNQSVEAIQKNLVEQLS